MSHLILRFQRGLYTMRGTYRKQVPTKCRLEIFPFTLCAKFHISELAEPVSGRNGRIQVDPGDESQAVVLSQRKSPSCRDSVF